MDDIFLKRLLVFVLTTTILTFQNCNRVEFTAYDPRNSVSLSSTNPDEPNNCSFNGQGVLHGSSIVTYAAPNVAFGQTCQSEVRTCHDGVLSGSFVAQTCTVAPGNSCVFNGQTIAHGSSVTSYQNSSVAFGQTCQSQSRLCNNGTLSGTYTHSTCTVANANNCTFNGQTVAHGSSVTSYQNSSVAFGQTCQSQSRSCNNGVLSGTYNFANCAVDQPSSCLFNGQTIAHGSSIPAYQNSAVPFGQTCTSENRSCNNGALLGSYSFGSCSVSQPSSCLFNGQTIAHGSSISAYQNSSVAFGQTCSAETRICNNGALSGSNAFASCAVGQPSSCLFNGQNIAHGQTVTAYPTSSVAFGQTCTPNLRTCNNGVLSGAGGFASCTVDSPSSCFLNGNTIAHGSSITAYLNPTPAYGVICDSQNRNCNNGTLSGSFTYTNCTVKVCNPNTQTSCSNLANGTDLKTCNAQGSGYGACVQTCTAGYYMSNGLCVKDCSFNGQTVPHGQSITAYQTVAPVFGQACSSQSRTCNLGNLSGSYTAASCTEKVCNPNTQTSCSNLANGTDLKTCNAQGSGYGACVKTCSTGYYMSNGSCVKDCSFNGQTVPHGQSITAYQSSSPAYGQNCSSQSRTCNLGNLNGSYTAASCTEKVCNPNTQTSCSNLANGTDLKTCNAQGSGYGSCVKTCSTGYYMSNGSCVKDCSFNGQTVPHGQSVTAYQSSSPAYGQNCSSQSRTCNLGNLSGSYTATSCTPKICNPGSYQSCGYLESGTNQRQCNAQGSSYGACVQACNSGYTYYGGQCWLTQCNPGGSRTCFYDAIYYSGDGGGATRASLIEMCGPNAQWELSVVSLYPQSYGNVECVVN